MTGNEHDRSPPGEDDDDVSLDSLEQEIDEFVRREGGTLPELFRDGLPPVPEGEPGAVGRLLFPDELIAKRYRVEEEIGHGAHGTVYRAVDVELNRTVAVKVLKPFVGTGAEVRRRRFEREAMSASRLSHANLCPVLHSGTHDDEPFIVMRLAPGRSLARLLQAARSDDPTATGPVRLPGVTQTADVGARIDAVLRMVEELATGLETAHQEGVFHRDVKPGNIVVDNNGHAVLVDFGCAHTEDGRDLSAASDVIGTIDYLPPESLRGGAEPDPRMVDVYGLGATLYHGLTLRRPHESPSQYTALRAALEDTPPEPRTLNAAISRDLDVVVRTAMESDPKRRYSSAARLAEELHRIRTGRPIIARPIGRAARLMRWARREPALAASLSGLILGFILVIGLLMESIELRHRADAASDGLRVSDLTRSIDTLWPRRDKTVSAMDKWLAFGRRLVAHHGIDGLVAEVEDRRRFALDLCRRSLEEPAELWRATVDDVRNDHGTYHGLELTPQLGLVPLGRDPQSGRHEFLHLDAHEGPIPRRRDGKLEIDENTGLVFVLLPGGTTWIGAQRTDPADPSYAAWARDHEDRATIELEPFFVSKYEVTNGQWQRIMREDPNRYIRPHNGMTETIRLHPVEMVSWDECVEFTRRIEVELPTEEQWEYAARAGEPATWWRDLSTAEVGARANLHDARRHRAMSGKEENGPSFDDGHLYHAPINRPDATANAFGLYDTIGNVWEWCRSWSFAYGAGSASTPENRAGAESFRPLRGSSFEDRIPGTHVAHRQHQLPRYRVHNVGFRPVRRIDP